MIGLKSLEFVLPERLVPINELEEITSLHAQGQMIYSTLKLETVSIAEGLDNIDLAEQASRQAMEAANVSPNEIDMIIFLQSRSPAYLMSPEAACLQERLGVKRGFSFAVTDLGCANISNALLIAENFLRSNEAIQNILIAGGSKPFGHFRYREGVTVIGDAGMGLIVGRTERNQILDVKLLTDGKFWDLYKIDYKHMLVDEYREALTSPRYKFELSIASRNNFNRLNTEICQENGIDQVNAYIMQNLSISAFAFNEDAFKVKFTKSCYDNCRAYGHLGSIDIMLNYKTAVQSGEIKEGDIVLIMNNSPVACWSTLLLQP